MIKYSFQEVSFFVREAKGKRIPEPALGNGEQTVDELPGYGKLNQPTPIASEGWNQVSNSRPAMEDFTAEDWTLLSQQKKDFYVDHQVEQVLNMLRSQENVGSFEYQINNYQHCLQSATMAMRDGCDEELVVCTLLHDVGFLTCPDNHGEFAATLLANYVSGKNYWLLKHHQFFLDAHAPKHPNLNTEELEKFRTHPCSEFTAEWVQRYDQNSIQSTYDTAPLEVFVPMVKRVFSRPPRGRILNS